MALIWKTDVNIPLVSFLLLASVAIMVVPCSACCKNSRCCNHKQSRIHPSEVTQVASNRRSAAGCVLRNRWSIAGCVLLLSGFISVFIVCLTFYYYAPKTVLRHDFDTASPVAVIGAGPSGLSAAWLLAQGGRQVTVFESSSDIGGHSKSWMDPDSNTTIDLGFIFKSIGGYRSYAAFGEHFHHTFANSSLNTSGFWNGVYWDNTASAPTQSQALEAEIDRFMQYAKEPPTVARLLTPWGLWRVLHRFSTDFERLCLDPTMSVLFVTKMGLSKQSTQAVLNHFKDDGFIHLRHDKPKVQVTVGGSQNLWKDVVADLL
eukprot:CAMPEP_0115510904 /NCGR_PEP_ID=MMETSP0271-20121206/73676_1 /TAXON_ID=71861 /ORGANISM="Scrippsiella trochoidea, Strain CCMP3099" /LENGTH=316 /DNA_ID=CAMNT_0002940929 /DNA_START=102 /DNA_END=1049 /DNA_ORIENTATION=-